MPKKKLQVTGKFIDPLVDFAFKKIFGSEPNKDLLIAFLNEVFRGRKLIVDLVYNKNEHPGDLKDEGAAIFDLLCNGDKGEQFLPDSYRERCRGANKVILKKGPYFILRALSVAWPQKATGEPGHTI